MVKSNGEGQAPPRVRQYWPALPLPSKLENKLLDSTGLCFLQESIINGCGQEVLETSLPHSERFLGGCPAPGVAPETPTPIQVESKVAMKVLYKDKVLSDTSNIVIIIVITL